MCEESSQTWLVRAEMSRELRRRLPCEGGAGSLAPEVWLLTEPGLGDTPRIKASLVALPATASLVCWCVWPITVGRSKAVLKPGPLKD